jgi:hypothetical protein
MIPQLMIWCIRRDVVGVQRVQEEEDQQSDDADVDNAPSVPQGDQR